MKGFVFCLLLSIVVQSFAQRTALLSKDLTQPIIYTDSITVQQLSTGYIPIDVSKIDTFYANLQYLRNLYSERQRSKMQTFELKAGTSTMTIERVPHAYGDRYNVTAANSIDNVKSSVLLASSDISNKNNRKKIEKLMDYISSNKSLFKTANEIHPKIYNAVVVSEF
jgi:hypothetical protein